LVDGAGQEHFALLRYNMGPAHYWPGDWSRVAPTSCRDLRPRRSPATAWPGRPGDPRRRQGSTIEA
jgi:hypothetical protein